jgi:3-isopropylmalate/(R)-2-methylmalate dehydratase large subunit
MAGMHALQKMIAARAKPARSGVAAGEFIEIEPDIFSVIVSFNATEARNLVANLNDLGVKNLPIKHKIIAFSDHGSPAPSANAAEGHKLWRDFYRAHGVNVIDGGAGVSHLVLAERGIAAPGDIVINQDSHAPTMGAIGAFGTSLGGGRMMLYALGRYWIEVPKVVRVQLEGRLRPGTFGRDVALHVNGALGQQGALGMGLEFSGSYVSGASMDMRFTLCNMGTEMGAVSSYIQPDATTLDWLKPRCSRPYTVFETDRDFVYESTHAIDVSDIEPQVAVPHSCDDVKPVSAVAGQHIDQAYLGSCASGRLEDIATAAALIKGRKVHPDVRLIVTPGSRDVLMAATRAGYIDTLHEANATVTNPNCGACPGIHGGILAPGEVAISTSTRNNKGRMGKGAEIYLASPATVVASAIAGCIANPGDYL